MATRITYTRQGDYLLPDLKLPEQPKVKSAFGENSIYDTSKIIIQLFTPIFRQVVNSLPILPILMKKQMKCLTDSLNSSLNRKA